jgi:hypothetical protein
LAVTNPNTRLPRLGATNAKEQWPACLKPFTVMWLFLEDMHSAAVKLTK